jgi:hypothetical protein
LKGARDRHFPLAPKPIYIGNQSTIPAAKSERPIRLSSDLLYKTTYHPKVALFFPSIANTFFLGQAVARKLGSEACKALYKSRFNGKSGFPPAMLDPAHQRFSDIIASIPGFIRYRPMPTMAFTQSPVVTAAIAAKIGG